MHECTMFRRNKLTCIADVQRAPDMIGNTADAFDMQIKSAWVVVMRLTSAAPKAYPDRRRLYYILLMSCRPQKSAVMNFEIAGF